MQLAVRVHGEQVVVDLRHHLQRDRRGDAGRIEAIRVLGTPKDDVLAAGGLCGTDAHRSAEGCGRKDAAERIPPGPTGRDFDPRRQPRKSDRLVPGEAYQRHRPPPRQFIGGRDLPICQCPVHRHATRLPLTAWKRHNRVAV